LITSRENRAPACSAAIPTGASRSGFPLNFLAIDSLRHLHDFFGDDLTVELPTKSGKKAKVHEVAGELERRLLSLFLLDANDRRPANGTNLRFQKDLAWRDSLRF
jgi:hypothetical protein